jgi:hypothetical protein
MTNHSTPWLRDCRRRTHAPDPQGPIRNGSHSDDVIRRPILYAGKTGQSNLRAEVPFRNSIPP